MMWTTAGILILFCFSTSQAEGKPYYCENVIPDCMEEFNAAWTRCYEERIMTCTLRRRMFGFYRFMVNSTEEARVNTTIEHSVQIPSSALKKSRGNSTDEDVLLLTTVISSSFFNNITSRNLRRKRSQPVSKQPVKIKGTVLKDQVLVVKAGNTPVKNLTEPIRLIFNRKQTVGNGTCVFWQDPESGNKTGRWSTEGCETSSTANEFHCRCNHLSFFAVLVNPNISIDKKDAKSLEYITYVGSAVSALFLFTSLFIYIGLHRRRPEKAIRMHIQLSVALLCLHLGFLFCSFWLLQLKEVDVGWVCKSLGLFLHWSLLATFTWIALEGFHLYLLLVRVFNIYVQRYLLKLSLVGWGLPTLAVAACGICGVYGKSSLVIRDSQNNTSTSQICWLSTDFPQRHIVSYSTVAFLCLVILCNSCMLGLVVFKLWRIRVGQGGYESSSDWKKMTKEAGPQIWKDCVTVLGLSCVLGLPWGLASTTYVSTLGIYIFTIFNSLQGLFTFLWALALSCKSRTDGNSSVKDPSSQKMMTTSFNN
ncbi:adhesion G-protein coupled receptor G1 isoform 2-T2 [Menidia menidia]